MHSETAHRRLSNRGVRGIALRLAQRLLPTVALALACATVSQGAELRFEVGGMQRRAILVNEAPRGQTRPAVLVLHGGVGNADTQRLQTGFDDVALREGFAVVYAEGTEWRDGKHGWNTGYLLRRKIGSADDIGYFDALIDLLVRQHGADRSRIYMTGGSNGAMMTLVYAVKRPEKLAAVAPVLGAMFSFNDKPSLPLPILLINAAQDNEVPITGGVSRNPMVRAGQSAPFKPLEETVAFWVAANRSNATPETEARGTYTTRTYPASPGGAVTISIIDSQGGHGWPGTASRRSENTPIQSFKGAEKVWEFFKQHKR
jgi:polyhydroxybutyrate depolymerase